MEVFEMYQNLNNQMATLGCPPLRAPKIVRRTTSSEGFHLMLDNPWDLYAIVGNGASIISDITGTTPPPTHTLSAPLAPTAIGNR
eukprot:12276686-Prorocentrum_lima.AAC.1